MSLARLHSWSGRMDYYPMTLPMFGVRLHPYNVLASRHEPTMRNGNLS